MMNIVDQYTSDVEVADEDGVVAIEYVVVGAAIVATLAVLWTLFGDTLNSKLNEVVNSITT